MSDSSGDDVTALLTDLVTTLRDLETAVEPRTERGRPRPPTPKELLRFTSDVTIPAAILVLRTNIEALKLCAGLSGWPSDGPWPRTRPETPSEPGPRNSAVSRSVGWTAR
ncbi:hypothetical protein ACFQH8_12140 [Halomicroarcula sp. GCM10025710]